MPKLVSKALTDLAVRKARPKDKRYDLYDAALRGFGVRVSTSGTKVWFVMRRVNGRMVRYSLGRYPEYSLTQARATSAAALKQMTEGEHPRAAKTFFAEDPKIRGQLKSLITEPYRTMEAKYRAPKMVKNHLSVLMASNEQFVVPAELEDRRFVVLDVSDKYKHGRDGSEEYFAPLWKAVKGDRLGGF